MRIVLSLSLLAGFMATSGCYAEGNSHFLADGETERFLTIRRCEAAATSAYQDGSPRYSGYICKEKLFLFTLQERRFESGKPLPAVR